MAFGNLDNDKEYPITQDAIDKGQYVLLSFKNVTEQLPNGKIRDKGIADPDTYRIGVFTQNTYDEYVRENEEEGKVNTFNRMLGKYIILHDPTLEPEKTESNDADNSDTQQSGENKPLTREQLLAQLEALDKQDGSDTDQNQEDLMLNTKPKLLEMLNSMQGVSDEDLKLAATPSTNKAAIVELITKYKQA